MTGRFVRMDWVNPHSLVYIKVDNADGTKTERGAETPPPNILYRQGRRRDFFREGEMLRLEVNGSFTTTNLHVVERLTMVDANAILWEATLTDPTIYTQPWMLSGNLARNGQPGYEQMEFACIEGSRDLEHYLENDGGTAQPGF